MAVCSLHILQVKLNRMDTGCFYLNTQIVRKYDPDLHLRDINEIKYVRHNYKLWLEELKKYLFHWYCSIFELENSFVSGNYYTA